jgi:hypothetical protein
MGFVEFLIIIFRKGVVMATEYTINGKKVKVDLDGEVFVDGHYTDLKKGSGIWMDRAGNEIKTLKGKSLEEALSYKREI